MSKRRPPSASNSGEGSSQTRFETRNSVPRYAFTRSSSDGNWPYIRNTSEYGDIEPVERMRSNLVNQVVSQNVPDGTSPDVTAWGVQMQLIGEGAYGAAYRVKVDDAALAYFKALAEKGTYRVVDSMPAKGKDVIVKVQRPRPGRRLNFTNLVHESTVHVQAAKTCHYSGVACSTKNYCLSDFVPRFYLSAYVASQDKYVTVMAQAPGKPVWEATRQEREVSLDVYLRIERALALMWAAGILHTDIHTNNMLWDAKTKWLTIIDFGLSIAIPEHMREGIVVAISFLIEHGTPSLGDVWDMPLWYGSEYERPRRVTNYANAVKAGLDTSLYYPDGKVLQYLYNKLSTEDKRRLPDMRRKLWGCKKAVTTPPSPPLPPRKQARKYPIRKMPGTQKPPSRKPARKYPIRKMPGTLPKEPHTPCKQDCASRGKVCNPASGRCRNPPIALLDPPCRPECKAQGKACNPATKRCRNPQRRRTPLQDCKQDCRALGKKCNPETRRCRKPQRPLLDPPCRPDCRVQFRTCNPVTKRCCLNLAKCKR